MLEKSTTPLVFTVRRQEAELVAPAMPTPRELKPLSNIDTHEGLRFQTSGIVFQRKKIDGTDPVMVIKEALAKTLVFYYPLAGRLTLGPHENLVVDCTGEGLMFIEADADVRLEDFGDDLKPPFPCIEELLFDVPGSSDVVGCPLVLIQITRLLCGGFILGVRIKHTIMDAEGQMQFMRAVAEIARGASEPSVLPVWNRELMNVMGTPPLEAPEEVEDTMGTIIPLDVNGMVQRSFFIGAHELSTLRRLLPPHLRGCSRFEVLAASLWRCRTIALNPNPEEEMTFMYVVNVRTKLTTPLPAGYYGNAIVPCIAVSTAGRISTNPLGYTLDLIRKTKAGAMEEHLKSVAELKALVPGLNLTFVSDITRVRFEDLDFGWGPPTYAGLTGGVMTAALVINYFSSIKTEERNGVLIVVCLPEVAMARFAEELDRMLKDDVGDLHKPSVVKISAL